MKLPCRKYYTVSDIGVNAWSRVPIYHWHTQQQISN